MSAENYSRNSEDLPGRDRDRELPEIMPGLGEIVPDEEDNKPVISPEERQKIIDGISRQENKDELRKEEIERIKHPLQ